MRRCVSLCALLLALHAAGCSSLTVNSDWDRDAPFETFQTFQWKPVRAGAEGGAMTELIQKRVERSAVMYLGDAGLKEATTDPDLLVVAHLGVADKVNVTDWGYSYSRDYWGYGGRNIDVYTYQEGTLIIDLIEAESTELVWRGWATKVVDGKSSPEQVDQEVDRVVAAILSRYPPPPR